MPRASGLELRRQRQQQLLACRRADELHADRDRPSGVSCSGSEIAGCPVTFHTGVNGTHSAAFISRWIGGSPSFGASPSIGSGGWQTVGVSSTSMSLQRSDDPA